MAQSRLLCVRVPATTVALVGLVLVTASWGSTFFMLRGVVSRMPAADFLAVRFVLATVLVALVAPGAVRRLSAQQRGHAVVLGVVYGLAQLAQTLGLASTSASVSGFLTGLYVVLTPLLAALLLRSRLGRRVWSAVLLATTGLALLSLEGVAVGGGEALTVVGALFYALHVVGLGVWSRPGSALGMTVAQLLAISVVCALGALPGGITLPTTGADWEVLIYMALVAGAAALIIQTWAQAQVSSTRAAIFMTAEPVWAAAFAVVFGGESLGARAVAGGALVLAAMYLVELGGTSRELEVPEPDAGYLAADPEPVLIDAGVARADGVAELSPCWRAAPLGCPTGGRRPGAGWGDRSAAGPARERSAPPADGCGAERRG